MKISRRLGRSRVGGFMWLCFAMMDWGCSSVAEDAVADGELACRPSSVLGLRLPCGGMPHLLWKTATTSSSSPRPSSSTLGFPPPPGFFTTHTRSASLHCARGQRKTVGGLPQPPAWHPAPRRHHRSPACSLPQLVPPPSSPSAPAKTRQHLAARCHCAPGSHPGSGARHVHWGRTTNT